jgi:succinate dehydrogenase/fumarate reductase iron-sulfur protein
MAVEDTVHIKVFRYDPSVDKQPNYETYRVPFEKGASVFNVLQYISAHCDGGLSYYASCRIGVCTGCMMKINGKPKLACSTLVEGDMTLEPLSKDKVIKDLLCRS